jgi:uncharacterized membrane protein (Fun14 family)
MTFFQMGGAGGLGFITGYAVKKILQAVMIIVGVFVMGLFTLAASGSVTIHWDKVFANANVASAHVTDFVASTGSVVFQHFPITAGFGLGFVFAFKR